jgi:PAS domain-containing protein
VLVFVRFFVLLHSNQAIDLNYKDKIVKFDKRNSLLREKAEQIVNFTPEELSEVSTDEIQRLFYDLQVYQVELEMQHDELKKAQLELSASHNRYHFLFHQVPVGIVIVDHNGFIENCNQFFCHMFDINSSDVKKKHLSSLIVEKDKNLFINRFNAFFKSPDGKSMKLQMQGNQNQSINVKLMGKLDTGSDFATYDEMDDSARLVITATDISDIISQPH